MFLLAANAVSSARVVPPLEVPAWLWIAFCAGTAALLLMDMFVFHRDAHEPTLRESAWWTVAWCTLALAFNGLIWWLGDLDHAVLFLTGYLIEWSLSMDNVFVFVVIFTFFGVPLKYQYRVLFWGILGAILMRLTFILVVGTLLQKYHWVMYPFGAFLIYTGIKLAGSHGGEAHPDQNLLLRFARKYLRVAPGSHGDKFFVRIDGKLFVTSLFLVLLVIESTDVVFAIDSVPAIFGVTKDTFIVFTSNVFAIMGLRALYFLLAGVMGLFRYLHYGLSAILVFIGIKMMLPLVASVAPDFEPYSHINPVLSLVIILGLLGTSVAASLIAARNEVGEAIEHADEPQHEPEIPADLQGDDGAGG